MLAIGLMSGTSMDGIDAALLELKDDGTLVSGLGHVSLDYDTETKFLLKALEYSVRTAKADLISARVQFKHDLHDYLANHLNLNAQETISNLTSYLHSKDALLTFDGVIRYSTDLHIVCVKQLLQKTGHQAQNITIIGYHGQTVYHRPADGITLSLGNPQHMADQLGIDVIHDFRREDVLAGGQGAPFAPLYHHALACHNNTIPIGIINCGGISNVTLIPNQDESDMIAFDTGPGNGLIDLLVRQRTHGAESMDRDGAYGQQGVVNEEALTALYTTSLMKSGQNYLLQAPPKSLDINDMRLVLEIAALNINDACATLETFTAITIVDGIRSISPVIQLPKRWILCGGGWKNPVIHGVFKNELRTHLGDDICVQTADDAGWNGQAIEAQIFAYLAARSLLGKPLSLPNTTGVPRPLTGGTCYKTKALARKCPHIHTICYNEKNYPI
ncbi:MAG: anhydro-N-acetylmuramic acid kinase [Pseudomonadota bacterium]